MLNCTWNYKRKKASIRGTKWGNRMKLMHPYQDDYLSLKFHEEIALVLQCDHQKSAK